MAGTRLGISELIRRAGDLPPLQRVAQKALEIIRDLASDMADLAEMLSLDTALAGLVLRWANSPYYGPASTISTVQQAVTYLGHNVERMKWTDAAFGELCREGCAFRQRSRAIHQEAQITRCLAHRDTELCAAPDARRGEA
ncbi:MAG: HDOD domain-containing protein [Chloroflexi bacterium]|nr:HDOD domain-containing protein [Chloroflexota bacterium]